MMGARLTLGLVAGLLLGCGTMQDMPLYDLDLRPTAEERVLNHVHRDIYLDEGNSIMFGQKPHPCKRVEVVREGSAEGADHVRVEWSQSDSCRYLGVGFPWANYMGKNLRPLEKVAAIQCHIKLEQGTASKVPMFFSLIDYAGRQPPPKSTCLTWRVKPSTTNGERHTFHCPRFVRPRGGEFGEHQGAAHRVSAGRVRASRWHSDCAIRASRREVSQKPGRMGALPLDLGRSKLWWGIQENAPSSSVFWSESQGVPAWC